MNTLALFAEPGRWPILFAAPLALVALRLADRRRARRVATLVGPRANRLAPDPSPRRTAGRSALLALGLLLALASTLHPVFGDATRADDERGVDLVVALDVSRSMLARDVAPDRLTRAHEEIRALCRRARGDRLALVAFAGEARTVVPLTRDLETLAELSDQTDPLAVRRGGTDLGAALEAAMGLLPADADRHAAILLVTDGEDLGGRGLATAERCRARGIEVHALGLGTGLGSKIALALDDGEAFLTDRGGAAVVSARDAAGLERIAGATGGSYLGAGAKASGLVSLYEERILPRARASNGNDARRRRENRYQWPLAGAFLCLLAALALPDRRRR